MASRFDMRSRLDASPGEFLLTWPSTSNRTYRIETAEEPGFFLPLVEHIAATPPQNSYTDTLHGAKQTIFYRVNVRP